jgi:SAM-dependent methyltransferase
MRQLQESTHVWDYNYRAGSPHLKHWHLYQRLLDRLRTVLDDLRARNLPWSVLDIGAGHGSFSEPLLAYGCRVTATEMSRPSLEVLHDRYGTNDRFSGLLDDGSLRNLVGEQFSLVLFASVLHHIPDYETAVATAASRLLPGGTFVAFQDPLWYPTMGRRDRMLSRVAYYSWRIRQGNYGRGVRTGLRRLRSTYDERDASDMVEYHVVRQGVNQERVRAILADRFREVDVIPYWSTQSGFWQTVGEAVGAQNTFGIVATSRWR